MEAKINARELRIGCWALFPDGKPHQIDGTDLFDMTTPFEDTKTLLTVSAIPLTEEILLKAGFQKNKHFHKVFHKSTWRVVFSNKGNKFYRSGTRIGGNIHYVHQLQNLYWCLCGQELQISL